MTEPDSPNGETLLIHDGELADVRKLLDRLGVEFREESSRTIPLEVYLGARLVISTPAYLLDRMRDGQPGEAERIVILEGGSRTLRSMLAVGSVEWIVCRPVHPSALRLLIVHCLYRGPEKRKTRRVSLGAEVKIQTGWRRRSAILAEVSERDCRVLSRQAPERGSHLHLHIPAEIAGSRLSLQARVIRAAPSGDSRHPTELRLLFDSMPAKEAALLRELVESYAAGPAILHGSEATIAAAATAEPPRAAPGRSLIAVGESASEETERAAPGSERAEERREGARYAFDRRVIAIRRKTTRVLVGSDISRRGMRVQPMPELSLDDVLKIAIHVSGRDTPLVLDVRVARDDGNRGLFLDFGALTPTMELYLDDVIDELGGLSAGGDPETESGESPRMVSEILEPAAS